MKALRIKDDQVSTHSRLKAAGIQSDRFRPLTAVSTHSRLKAAGKKTSFNLNQLLVSTHSRLKAAGFGFGSTAFQAGCFNTQPPEGGWNLN